MGLTGRHPAFMGAILFCCITADMQAQSADSLAIPVRKGASSTVERSKSEDESSKSSSKSRSSSSKETASVSRTGSSKSSSSSSDSRSDAKSSRNGERESERTSNSSRKAASPSSRSDNRDDSNGSRSSRNESASNSSRSRSEETAPEEQDGDNAADLAAVANLRSAGISDDSVVSEVGGDTVGDEASENKVGESATEVVSVPGPQTTIPELPYAPTPAVTAPQPNMYVPQATTENKGILSRLFGRKKVTPTSPARIPTNFTSDYTKRNPNTVLPAVLSGNGINGSDIPIGSEDSYRLASALPTDFRPTDLVQIPRDYCHYNNQLYLRREAASALCSMIYDAQCQGLNIEVVSAFRDYGHQLRLYNQSVAKRGPNQKMVAKPGKSEHFLGTTVDLTNSKEHALKRSFGETPEGKWLAANAHRYGWKMTVMSGEGRRSHNDEPWHLRYLGSSVNTYSRNSAVAQTQPQPQRRDVMGRIGKFLGLRR